MQLSVHLSQPPETYSLTLPSTACDGPANAKGSTDLGFSLYDSALTHTYEHSVTGFIDLMRRCLMQGSSGRASQESGS